VRELLVLQKGEHVVCCISPLAVIKASTGGERSALSGER